MIPRPRGAYPPPGMLGPRALAWWALRTQTTAVRVEGLEHVPRDGPVLLVARHYHHLLDGAVLVNAVPRPVHVLVALDWTASPRARRWMERACRWAQWPVILRERELAAGASSPSAFARADALPYLRRGLRDAAHLLAEGRVVAVFPEGYPAVDPSPRPAPPRDLDGFLPFARGFSAVARFAAREGADVVAVPVGFRYAREGKRWSVIARFGEPLPNGADAAQAERAVRALSR